MSSNKENRRPSQHPGCPLQQSGAAADSWNEVPGSSLEVISQLHLPTNRSVLKRFRSHRTTNELVTINYTPGPALVHPGTQRTLIVRLCHRVHREKGIKYGWLMRNENKTKNTSQCAGFR